MRGPNKRNEKYEEGKKMTSKAVNAYQIVIVEKSVEFRRATVIIVKQGVGGRGWFETTGPKAMTI